MSQSPQQYPENHQTARSANTIKTSHRSINELCRQDWHIQLGEVWWFGLCQSWSLPWKLAGGHHPQDPIVGRYHYQVYTMQSMHHMAEAPEFV
jgi:hypothetical protein